MEELIGKKILSIDVNSDQSLLRFTTDQGIITYQAYGDCCSQSWFADITGVDALINGTVNRLEEVSLGHNVENDPRTRQEYDDIYGYKFTTDKGWADIVFRNSSNGYYGGWLELYEGNFDGESMTPITEDWSA